MSENLCEAPHFTEHARSGLNPALKIHELLIRPLAYLKYQKMGEAIALPSLLSPPLPSLFPSSITSEAGSLKSS